MRAVLKRKRPVPSNPRQTSSATAWARTIVTSRAASCVAAAVLLRDTAKGSRCGAGDNTWLRAVLRAVSRFAASAA